MTGWHLDDDALRSYVERTDSLAEGASVEQHLLSCEPCRAQVNAAADVIKPPLVARHRGLDLAQRTGTGQLAVQQRDQLVTGLELTY